MYLVTKGFFLINKEAKVSGPVILHIHFWYSYIVVMVVLVDIFGSC